MARINKNKTFTGLVGTVILSSWKGIEYIKHRGRKSNKPRSIKQLAQQQKIAVISKFIYSMNELLDKTFRPLAEGKTGANMAFSYNAKNTIIGNYPFFSLDYSRALVSRGDLPNALNPSVATTGNGQLLFRWSDNSGTGQAKPADKCIVVAHFPELNKITIWSDGNEKRQDEAAIIDLAKFKGNIAECWVVFMSLDEKEVANSVYVGSLTVI